MYNYKALITLILCILSVGATPAIADATSSAKIESAQDCFASLTPAEQGQFQAAGKDFSAARFAEALEIYKPLMSAHPQDQFLAKISGEAAVDSGDMSYAKTHIGAVLAQNPDDWQALGLQARIDAASGDKVHRDAVMAKLAGLYKAGIVPQEMQYYVMEKIPIGDKQLLIFPSFYPWGRYKVYDYARLLDSKGQIVSRITLESSDFDQPNFAQQHPKEAAAGMRMFSYDGYTDNGPNAAGQHSETHATYGFVNGQPTYDEVRARFIAIASGKNSRLSDNVHPIP